MWHTLLSLLAFSLSVFIVAAVLPGVKLKGFGTAVIVALVFGLLKWLFYNLLIFLSLPVIALTFGLFLIVIHAILLWMTDKLVSGFKIKGFGTTVLAAMLISLLDLVFRWLLPGI